MTWNIFPPLSYVRSGFVNLSAGTLSNAGLNGYAWTLASYSSGSTGAYYLYFSASGVDPSNYGSRWYGFPVPSSA